MKPFKFKLQTSLDMQHHKEELQQKDLADKTEQKKYQETILSQYEQAKVALLNSIRQYQIDRVDVMQLQAINQFLPVLDEKIQLQRHTVEFCQRLVEESRSTLLEIVKGRKVLEKLKVKHYDIYKYDAERVEQKILDEMATNAYLRSDRKRSTGG